MTMTAPHLTHLQRLEAEAIHIMREVVAECEKPVVCRGRSNAAKVAERSVCDRFIRRSG